MPYSTGKKSPIAMRTIGTRDTHTATPPTFLQAMPQLACDSYRRHQ